MLEVSCGTGQGLGYTARAARGVVGADITFASLAAARRHYGSRIPLVHCDALRLPFLQGAFDAVAIHEAIYYYSDVTEAFREAYRVLRSGGKLFVSTVNPEWADFNPSAFSTRYLAASSMAEALADCFTNVELFGAFPVERGGSSQVALSVVKRAAVAWGLIPKTMKGKRFLKRLVYGELVPVPAEIAQAPEHFEGIARLTPGEAAIDGFKVLYAIAQRP